MVALAVNEYSFLEFETEALYEASQLSPLKRIPVSFSMRSTVNLASTTEHACKEHLVQVKKRSSELMGL